MGGLSDAEKDALVGKVIAQWTKAGVLVAVGEQTAHYMAVCAVHAIEKESRKAILRAIRARSV